MATRFYLPQSGTTPASPAYSSVWENTSNGFRAPLVTTPSNTSTLTKYVDKPVSANPYDSMAAQWVSAALPAGAISGTFTAAIGTTETSSGRNAFLQCVIRVVSGDGSTVRGTLYAGQIATTASATATDPNFEFQALSMRVRTLSASVSSVTAEAGDRIVVELGARAATTDVYTNSVAIAVGDQTSSSDIAAATDGAFNTGSNRSWVEFSQDLFSGGPEVVSRTGTVSGAGSFTATALAVAVAAGLLPGAGSFTATSVAVERVTASLAGAGEFSATAYAVGGAIPVAGTIEGAGEFTATATAVLYATGTIAGAGSFTATAFVVAPDGTAYTETASRVGGRTRDGVAVAEWEPAVVQPPTGTVAEGHRRIRAVAFGELTRVLPPTYSTSEASALRLRTRVMVGGRDISFHGGVPTPEPEYQLAEPLLWGPSSVEIPSIPAAFFNPVDYPWLAKGKTVTYQRVTADGTKVGVDYRGVVIAYDVSGRNLRLEVGGHGQGRAALRHKPLPIFRDTLDLGRLAWAAVRDLGLRFTPRLGPTTGIRQALFGGMDHLSYISEVCAKAFDADGQWSLMPDESGAYSFTRKDRDTVHWTLFNDDARVVADLRSDAAEEPNRVFAGGVTPKGQRVRFGVYPGLKPGPAAPYPFTDGRTFGLGTLDSETDTGDGVTVMLRKLWTAGYLSLEEMDGQYDATVTRAVMALQDDAGKPTTGNMNPATWGALFDLGVTGYTLRGSRIEPAAQDYRVRRYNRSASGQVIGRNPNFDPSRLIVDREIDFGSGFTRDRMRDWSRAEVYRGEDNWFGTITIHAGGILVGDVAVGATITDANVADVREIRPGQNVRLPMFGGGVLLHISGVEISRSESGHPVARLTVDTQARDALPVWEQIRRNRETRRDAGRRWKGNRASTEVKDSIDVWDEVGGVLYGDRELAAGWNKVTVVGGQEGTVSRLRLVVQTVEGGEEIVISGVEFACAVAGRRISTARMNTLVPNPLAGDGSIWANREAELRKAGILYSAGTNDEPCGYGAGSKSNGATLTGLHVDDAGFSYRCGPDHLLDVLIWVGVEGATLLGGRVMWNQLEAGA